MSIKRIGFESTLGLAAALASATGATSQTADQAWLGYRGLPEKAGMPREVRALGEAPLEKSAEIELRRAIAGLSAAPGRATSRAAGPEIVLGTVREVEVAFPSLSVPKELAGEGYSITPAGPANHASWVIAGGDERGVLYGAFALLRWLVTSPGGAPLAERDQPAIPLRWVDEWDNADGTVERGYAGRSIFFEAGKVRDDLKPVEEYARLLASIGINGCNANNVNNASAFLETPMLEGLARAASAMRPWGVRLAISADVASPQKIGGLPTYDPLDPRVKAWWQAKVDEIYALIPDFAGFTVKADSEGQPGPASYGRTPADAANTLAAALAPHGGVVLYRAFVYNHHLDWTDLKADRARAAFDIFHPLDGKFAANVIVQTKEGPIDFQVREPVSPLFGGLNHTSQALEVEITQEYTGQQRHLVYLAPMWKQVLDFDMRVKGRSTPVRAIVAGRSFSTGTGGMIGVAGVGREGWLGSPLAMANLYAFGRLAWNPGLDPARIAREWTRLTLSSPSGARLADADVERVVGMLMRSWPAYEEYTGPLGLQTLTDITGSHYGPGIEGSENNGWGQWHRADHEGVGMDRSLATGTGFAGQYAPEVAKIFEATATTPDNLLLFFHHVPYTSRLHDGKTVIQYLYDSHYAGAAEAARSLEDWEMLQGKIDPTLFADVRARLEYQAGHAVVWRDAVVQYFLRLSGIADQQGRAGHYPGRMEAEDARLAGYQVVDVEPWEDASGGKAISCPAGRESPARTCSAEWTYTGPAGRFDVTVEYFDLSGGVARFELEVDGADAGPEARWAADSDLPTRRLDGDNSTRHSVHGVALRPGDTLRVLGSPDGSDPAALDYIEVTREGGLH
jgi:alpha-glucuronidase